MIFQSRSQILISILLVLLTSCIVDYIPQVIEEQELLVVDGMITNQPGINTVTIVRSFPLWKQEVSKPLKGCKVWLSDDLGRIHNLRESITGKYLTDSATFRGEPGRKYILHITAGTRNYESFPAEMKPVPPIDTVYYEKTPRNYSGWKYDGCNILLDTHDPTGNCDYFRWDYTETWEFHVPFDVPNRVCWHSEDSRDILIKNTAVLTGKKVSGYPLLNIESAIERMKIKYSLLVNQYSMNEDEYLYWEKLKNTLDETGGLYDLIPAYIPNNIFCIENPEEKILGYFSVSAVTSERIFIKDKFEGTDGQFLGCTTDTVYGTDPIPGIDSTVWVIKDLPGMEPPVRILTDNKKCADCTEKGYNYTTSKPSFWDED